MFEPDKKQYLAVEPTLIELYSITLKLTMILVFSAQNTTATRN